MWKTINISTFSIVSPTTKLHSPTTWYSAWKQRSHGLTKKTPCTILHGLYLLKWKQPPPCLQVRFCWFLLCFTLHSGIKEFLDCFCCQPTECGMVMHMQQVWATTLVFCVTSHNQYQNLGYMHFCDHLQFHHGGEATSCRSLWRSLLAGQRWPNFAVHHFLWHLWSCVPWVHHPGSDCQVFCCIILRDLMEDIWCKLPQLWCNDNWVLHHDNILAYCVLKTCKFFGHSSTTFAPHLLYLVNVFDYLQIPPPQTDIQAGGLLLK